MKPTLPPALLLLTFFSLARVIGQDQTVPAPCWETARYQVEINQCAHDEADRLQRLLDRLLAALEERLPAGMRPALTEAQEDWKTFAEADCRWEESFYDGGSMAPAVYDFCRAQNLAARIDRLRLWLCEGGGSKDEPCAEAEAFAPFASGVELP